MTLSAKRLFIGAGAPNTVLKLYEVPAGKLAIVRDIVVMPSAAPAKHIELWVETPASGSATALAFFVEATSKTHKEVDRFLVMHEGDELFVYPTDGYVNLMISGHEFTV